MSLHPQRSWTHQPSEFAPAENNIRRHASIPAFPLLPHNNIPVSAAPPADQFQPRSLPHHFNGVPPAQFFPGGVPPNMMRMPPPHISRHPPPPLGPVVLPPSLGGGPSLPKKPTPGGLGLYKGETPRPPLKEEFVEKEATRGTTSKPIPPRGSAVPEEVLERAQHQWADKVWLEEQERQRREVESERRKYEIDRANGITHRPPVPKAPSSLASTVFDTDQRRQQRSDPTPAHHPAITAPGAQPHYSPPAQQQQQQQQHAIAAAEEQERRKRQAQLVMEAQLKRQEAAKEAAKDAARREAELAAQRKAEHEAEMQRQEKERKERARREAEEERLRELREREKFEEECRRVAELQDAQMKANADQEAFRREYLRRAELKRSQLRREKEDRRQTRQRRRDHDAWMRAAPMPGYAWPQPRRFPPYAGVEDRATVELAMYARPSGRRSSQSENDPLEQHAHISEIDEGSVKADSEDEIRRVRNAHQRFESLWNLFVKQAPPPNSLRFTDIPWPTAETLPPSPSPPSPHRIASLLNYDDVSHFLFSPHHSQGKTNRTRIRSTMARFQPDKISRFLSFVVESERPAVAMGIDITARMLAEMMVQEMSMQTAIAGGDHN